MQSSGARESRQDDLSGSSEPNRLQAMPGSSMSLTSSREQDASSSKRSILGDVRRITPRKAADGRDLVKIEHTDGTETILVFDTVS